MSGEAVAMRSVQAPIRACLRVLFSLSGCREGRRMRRQRDEARLPRRPESTLGEAVRRARRVAGQGAQPRLPEV